MSRATLSPTLPQPATAGEQAGLQFIILPLPNTEGLFIITPLSPTVDRPPPSINVSDGVQRRSREGAVGVDGGGGVGQGLRRKCHPHWTVAGPAFNIISSVTSMLSIINLSPPSTPRSPDEAGDSLSLQLEAAKENGRHSSANPNLSHGD